jgi:D-hydroxyproline dehydrogenase subunit gamma
MSDAITLHINGAPATVRTGTTLAAAILNSGCGVFRRSVGGEARAPLCGMGICFECRVTVDGVPHVPSCQLLCRDGMDVSTDE